MVVQLKAPGHELAEHHRSDLGVRDRLLFAPDLDGERACSKDDLLLWGQVPHQDEPWQKDNQSYHHGPKAGTQRFVVPVAKADNVGQAEGIEQQRTDHHRACQYYWDPHGGIVLPVGDRAHLAATADRVGIGVT